MKIFRDRVTITLYVVLITAITLQPSRAWADGFGGSLNAIDLTDSNGIELSRYALSIPDSNPLNAALYSMITMAWDSYRWTIATAIYLVDWTSRMEWITTITGPIGGAVELIRTQFLSPLGATTISPTGFMGLAFAVAGLVMVLQLFRRTSRGLLTVAQSALAASIAVGLLAAPVALFAGDKTKVAEPLDLARRTGIALSTAAVTGKAEETTPQHGKILVDAFIRPVHQALNYGGNLDTNPICKQAYDDALKQAKTQDDLKHVKDKIGAHQECSQYKTYADNPNTGWLVSQALFGISGQTLTLLLLVFLVCIWLAVIMLVWSSVAAMFHSILAIMPGPGLSKLIRDFANIAVSLVMVVVALVMLGVIISIIQSVFVTTQGDLIIRFLAADMIMIAGIVLLLVNTVLHIRGSKTLTQRLLTQLRQPNLKSSLTEKAWNWAKAPSNTTPAKPGLKPKTGTATGIAAAAISPRLGAVMNSNAGRLAMTGAKLAAAAATGGGTLAVTAAKTGGLAALRTAYATRQNIKAGANGETPPIKTGIIAETAAMAAGRAHSKVQAARQLIRTQPSSRSIPPTTGSTKLDAWLLARNPHNTNPQQLAQLAKQDRVTARSLAGQQPEQTVTTHLKNRLTQTTQTIKGTANTTKQRIHTKSDQARAKLADAITQGHKHHTTPPTHRPRRAAK